VGTELSGYGSDQEENLKGYGEDSGYEGEEASGGEPGEYSGEGDYSGQGEYSGQGGFSQTPLVEEYSGGSLTLLPPPSGRRGKVSVERAPKEATARSKLGPRSKSNQVSKSKRGKNGKSKANVESSISRKGKELRKLKPPSSKNRSGPRIRSVNSSYHYY